MTERDFKGVWIPKEIWLDERLNALDKIILAEIDSLDKGEDGCWASNKYIADFCQCSERKVSDAISKLVKLNYLYVKSFDGRQRTLRSRLANFARQTDTIFYSESQNLRQTNTNTNTSTKTNKRFTPPTVSEVSEYCKERKNDIDPEYFVDYYTTRDWKVGKNKMKDWKAAVRTWERNSFSSAKKSTVPRDDSLDDIF